MHREPVGRRYKRPPFLLVDRERQPGPRESSLCGPPFKDVAYDAFVAVTDSATQNVGLGEIEVRMSLVSPFALLNNLVLSWSDVESFSFSGLRLSMVM